jgi:hypothetical protein
MIIQTLIGSSSSGGANPGGMTFADGFNYYDPIYDQYALVFSNFNKTATDNLPGQYSTIMTNSITSGKYMFSLTMDAYTDPYSLIGFATAAIVLDNYIGSDTNSFGIDNLGNAYYNGTVTDSGLGTFTSAGDIIDFAIEIVGIDAHVWIRVNNSNWNGGLAGDPAAGTGYIGPIPITGPIFPALTIGGISFISTFTINLNSPYSVPSGFTYLG